jgi:hypothetical protein
MGNIPHFSRHRMPSTAVGMTVQRAPGHSSASVTLNTYAGV